MKTVTGLYRNQRIGRPQQRRQHLLEVSIRRDKERARQFRRAVSAIFKLLICTAFISGTYFGAKEGLRRWFWENPRFFVESILVSTDGSLTREQILSTAGVSTGQHILSINLGQVRNALAALPQVENAQIRRHLFQEVEIQVQERQPIAWITEKPEETVTETARTYLIDARGVILQPRRLLPEYNLLPVITGVVIENLPPGQKADTLELQAALELVRLCADSLRWQPRQIDISKGYCLVVSDRTRKRVTFGVEHIDEQLVRFYRLLDFVQPTHREIRTVNLLVERNTPVTFTEPAPVAAAPEAEEEITAPMEEPEVRRAEPAPESATPAKASPATATKSKTEKVSKSRTEESAPASKSRSRKATRPNG